MKTFLIAMSALSLCTPCLAGDPAPEIMAQHDQWKAAHIKWQEEQATWKKNLVKVKNIIKFLEVQVNTQESGLRRLNEAIKKHEAIMKKHEKFLAKENPNSKRAPEFEKEHDAADKEQSHIQELHENQRDEQKKLMSAVLELEKSLK